MRKIASAADRVRLVELARHRVEEARQQRLNHPKPVPVIQGSESRYVCRSDKSSRKRLLKLTGAQALFEYMWL
eukprot:4817089-Pleurochrysis_carterae.AAC.1